MLTERGGQTGLALACPVDIGRSMRPRPAAAWVGRGEAAAEPGPLTAHQRALRYCPPQTLTSSNRR